MTYFKLPDYAEHLGQLSAIKQELSDLCLLRLGKQGHQRLLLVIDDLDRCSQQGIIDTLDALRLFAHEHTNDGEEAPHITTLLAVDDRVVLRALAETLQTDGNER